MIDTQIWVSNGLKRMIDLYKFTIYDQASYEIDKPFLWILNKTQEIGKPIGESIGVFIQQAKA